MPALSLVVCLHNEREFLQRLLQKAEGCYDDLVVVHDGPDETHTRVLVEAAGFSAGTALAICLGTGSQRLDFKARRG